MEETLVDWLLDSDPAVRWQVMRDLLDRPESEWMAERARVETEGWGARLLAHQDPDGQWAGGAFVPLRFTPELWESEGQPWTATTYALTDLREFGLLPSSESARRTVSLVGRNARWDHDGQAFWEGEVEECINGRTVAAGAYFGVDVGPIVERLLAERQADGGWNCERANGSVRSSFDTTINVVEGLLEYEMAVGGDERVRAARESAEEFLLVRGLFRRLGTGAPAHADFMELIHPTRWYYTVLRGLDHFRAGGMATHSPPDPRMGDAIDHVRALRRDDGRWPLDRTVGGRSWLDLDDGPGAASRWITLQAMRVLRWFER